MIEINWIRGFRLGLWYFDFTEWDDDETNYDFAVSFDLAFISVVFYLYPRNLDVDDLL